MYTIKINNKCKDCGMCLVIEKYFSEDIYGKITAKKGVVVSNEDLSSIENLKTVCPFGAIELIEESYLSSKQLALKCISNAEQELKSLKIERIKRENVKFDAKRVYFDSPVSPNEYTTDYKSEYSCKQGARNDFDKLVYCESARNPQLSKVIVEYKVENFRKYYDFIDSNDNYYNEVNKQVEQIFTNLLISLKNIYGDKMCNIKIDINTTPNKNNLYLDLFNQFPQKYILDNIFSYVRDLGPTTLGDYVDYMDFDYFDWADSGFLSVLTRNRDWNFSNFDKAVDEFHTDLKRALSYYGSDYEDELMMFGNNLLEEYENNLRKLIDVELNKIKEAIKML